MIMLQRFIWNSHKNSYLITMELLLLRSHEVGCGCDSCWRSASASHGCWFPILRASAFSTQTSTCGMCQDAARLKGGQLLSLTQSPFLHVGWVWIYTCPEHMFCPEPGENSTWLWGPYCVFSLARALLCSAFGGSRAADHGMFQWIAHCPLKKSLK